jgi:hypothetical protein
MDAPPTAATFTPHVGEVVRLSGGQALTLSAVQTPSAAHRSAPDHQPFTLLLRGQRSPALPEGLHRFTLDGGATFELYMMPIHTPSGEHQDYQIVFN